MKNKNRVIILDVIRGLAVIGMVVFHLLFIINFITNHNFDLYTGGYLILARSVEFAFITLVGVCMALSYQGRPKGFITRQFKRFLHIGFCALLVTLGTYYTQPEFYVRFGILHFIAVASLIVMFFARFTWLNLSLAIFAFSLGTYLQTLTGNSLPLTLIGFKNTVMNTFDLFPIFPWISFMFLGLFLGNLGIKKKFFALPALKMASPFFAPFAFIGRHALLIYVVHIPIIVVILSLFGLNFA